MRGADSFGFESQPAMHTPPSFRTDDTLLIRRAQRGDAAAFEALARQYDENILRLARHLALCEQDARDIYQQTFLQAYCKLNSFRFESSFYTWIYRIATDLCLEYLRHQQKVGSGPYGRTADQSRQERMREQGTEACPEPAAGHPEVPHLIAAALRKLSPKERMIFELKHYHGLKLHTVAQILSTTETVARNAFLRATQKLRLDLSSRASGDSSRASGDPTTLPCSKPTQVGEGTLGTLS